jgi:hypothetical protein
LTRLLVRSPPRAMICARSQAWKIHKSGGSEFGMDHERSLAAFVVFSRVNYEYRHFVVSNQCQYERYIAGRLSTAPRFFTLISERGKRVVRLLVH